MKMKQTWIKAISSVFFAVILAFSFASCSEGADFEKKSESDQAIWLYDRFDSYWSKNGKNQKSATIEISGNIEIAMLGIPVTAEISGKMIYEYDFFGGLSAYHEETETRMEMEYNGEVQTQIMKSSDGFQNGRMYITSKNGETEYRFASQLSAKEYSDHKNSAASESDDSAKLEVTANNHTTRFCVKNEDGSYLATFEGFTADAVQAFGDNFGSSILSDGYTLTDMKITLSADQDLTPLSMRIEFVIDAEEDLAPASFYMEIAIRDIGASKVPQDLGIDSYQSIGDLRIYDTVDSGFSRLFERDNGYFKANITQDMTADGTTRHNPETDKGHYGKDENGYLFFDVEAKTTENTVVMTYEKGYMKTYVEGVLQTNTIIPLVQAESSLKNVIDPADIDITEIAEMQKEERGGKTVYTILLNETHNEGEFEALMTQIGARKIKSTNCSLICIFENGEIVQRIYKAELTMEVQTSYTFDVVITLENDATFSLSEIP